MCLGSNIKGSVSLLCTHTKVAKFEFLAVPPMEKMALLASKAGLANVSRSPLIRRSLGKRHTHDWVLCLVPSLLGEVALRVQVRKL